MIVLKIAQRLGRRWSTFRVAQLLIGVVSIGAGLDEGIWLLVAAGVAMFAGSLLGLGCAGACAVDASPHTESKD